MPASAPDPERSAEAPLPPEAKAFGKAAANALKRARRKQEKLEADLARAADADEVRRRAELLKAALPDLKRGQDAVVVRDFFADDPGATARIPLDPARPPRDTMQKLFKEARRRERGQEKIEAELVRNRRMIESLAHLVDAFDAWRDERGPDDAVPPALLERARELRVPLDTVLPPAAAAPAPPRKLSRREQERQRLLKGVRTFESRDGLTLWVGKSSRDNDALSFRLANGNDWWFHLAPAAGSHVVARNDGREACPQETLLDAAHLAVHYSKMRGARAADVTFTQAKHIRRIRGAPPGKVRVERSKTVHVRMEPDRLDRLQERPAP